MTLRPGRPPGLIPDGQKIRSLRVDQGVTLTEMALRIGYHPKNLSKVERQDKALSDVIASRLAKALSTPDEPITVADITVSDGTGSGGETKIPA
ncbi:MAG TPA: helix-turn-helix transcriptional regulator [Streptomyces sp.]|nr:helix-turn-helix transcriptional regulator [Streptomyces sp.]